MQEIPTWRVIDTKEGTAAWNMAVDEALLRLNDGLPVLRLYGWKPAMSIGRHQRIDGHFDKKCMGRSAYDMVRRMSGGGALIHGGDLSYAMIVPKRYLEGLSVKEGYRMLCSFLIRLYEALGFTARFAIDAGFEEQRSAVCLLGREAYDIMIGFRKIGGNAQRHTRKALLQHGTIPLRLDADREKALFLDDPGLDACHSLKALGREMTYAALADLLLKSVGEAFGSTLRHDILGTEELAMAKSLHHEKYNTEAWNYDGHCNIG